MDEIGKLLGETIAGVIGHPVVQLSLRLTAAYVVVLWLVSAFWTFRDVRQRTRDPISPYLAAGGVVFLTPMLFPLALLAYRVVRPPETLTERATRDLESYVLEASVERTGCSICGRLVEEAWLRCPACGSDLAGSCRSCGGRIEFDWSVCAWCARDLEPAFAPRERPAVVAAIDVPAAAADLGASPGVVAALAAEPLIEPALTAVEPGIAGHRPGAIPGWDPSVLAVTARPEPADGPRPGAIDGWDADGAVLDPRDPSSVVGSAGPDMPARQATHRPDPNPTEVGMPVFGPTDSRPAPQERGPVATMRRAAEERLRERDGRRDELVTSPPDRDRPATRR